MPLLFKLETGERREYPVGRPRDVAEDLQDAKLEGFSVCEVLVSTATGCSKPVCVEEQVNSGRAAIELLSRKRSDGKPAFLPEGDWLAMSDAQRDAWLVKPKAEAQPVERKGK